MSLAEILSTGLLAGVVVQIIQVIRDYFSIRAAQNKSAKRQAFVASNKLMLFSIACEHSETMHQLSEIRPNQEAPDPPNVPDFDFLKLTQGLDELRPSILARIATLAFQSEFERNYINFGWQAWMGLGDVGEIQLKRLNFLKEEARTLAEVLRSEYRLPEFSDHTKLIAT